MKKDNSKVIGAVGALLVHVLFIILLFLIGFSKPEVQEESGVPVMLGNIDISQESFDPALATHPQPQSQEIVPEEKITEVTEEETITQAEEETVVIKPKTEPKPKKEKPKQESKKPEKTEAEKRAEAEKAAAEAANQKIAGAFGKGSQMGNKGTGTTGAGAEGSLQGNASTGKSSGVGGYGTFDLNGRSLGPGGLPRPAYNVKDEGKVVVDITVNSSGVVINTSINRHTNTVNAALRKAAEDAARKARFNDVGGVNNQTGTITYYFNLK